MKVRDSIQGWAAALLLPLCVSAHADGLAETAQEVKQATMQAARKTGQAAKQAGLATGKAASAAAKEVAATVRGVYVKAKSATQDGVAAGAAEVQQGSGKAKAPPEQ